MGAHQQPAAAASTLYRNCINCVVSISKKYVNPMKMQTNRVHKGKSAQNDQAALQPRLPNLLAP